MSTHPCVPPEIEALLPSLARHDVRYVVFGSGGALLYGATIAPGDFDICPALDSVSLLVS